jgi:hypothetical protein
LVTAEENGKNPVSLILSIALTTQKGISSDFVLIIVDKLPVKV